MLLQDLTATFTPLMEWVIDRLEPSSDCVQLVRAASGASSPDRLLGH